MGQNYKIAEDGTIVLNEPHGGNGGNKNNNGNKGLIIFLGILLIAAIGVIAYLWANGYGQSTLQPVYNEQVDSTEYGCCIDDVDDWDYEDEANNTMSNDITSADTSALDYAQPESDLFVCTATINKIWGAFDYEKNMEIHVEFNIYKAKGIQCLAVAYFYYANGTPIEDINQSYRTTTGQVSASTPFNPNYENCYYSNLCITIPYNEIHTIGEETQCYAIVILYAGNDYRYLVSSDKIFFTK